MFWSDRLGKKLIAVALTIGLGIGAAGSSYPGSAFQSKKSPRTSEFDLVVYGGTPGGVMAAIAAARRGLNVVLLTQGPTVGGTMSNGLGATDLIVPSNVSGIPLEFFREVQRFYGKDTWRVSSALAESIFRKLLNESRVSLQTKVVAVKATVTSGNITCISTKSKTEICAKQFIDASYTADLLPLTKTKFKLGKEDLFDYGDDEGMKITVEARTSLPKKLTMEQEQSLAGLPFIQHVKNFKVSKVNLTEGMPSFTYRFCITKDNNRPFRLSQQDVRHIPAWRLIAQSAVKIPCPDCEETKKRVISRFWRIANLDGKKWDMNSFNSFTNFPIPRSYFNDHSTRAKTNAEAARYIESFVAFLQSDKQVPAVERKPLEGFGMCADEFTSNNNVPHEPYIREGRRVVGKTVLLTSDEKTNLTKWDSIGIAKYHIDNKLSMRFLYKNKMYRDYTTFQKSNIYQIPFSITIPKHGPKNLLVAVGVSTSPLAYGSIRMEPHYMLIGQATGVASALAIRDKASVGEISVPELQNILREWGQKLSVNN
jgi:hypothetical protein